MVGIFVTLPAKLCARKTNIIIQTPTTTLIILHYIRLPSLSPSFLISLPLLLLSSVRSLASNFLLFFLTLYTLLLAGAGVMDVQAHQEEFVGSNDHQALVIKGKRTKRQRPSSPFGVTVTCSSSSASIGGGGVAEEYNSISSPTTSGEIHESTEEEEDMANCLIMLAQSDGPRKRMDEGKFKVGSRKLSEIATTTNKAGFFVYECKTCNRSFPSFQALGGHRASHKKPKATMAEDKKPLVLAVKDDKHVDQELQSETPLLALQVTNNNSKGCQVNKGNKIHECSICGSEFSSGQALGGHMRRHRAAAATTASNQVVVSVGNGDGIKPRNILSLDLNLPAPEDDLRDSKFQFGAPQQAIVFSTPALVDCHY
ncbi:hypothetical protein GOBAR_AA26095 [Gossypium barbadense]|uniref:C2H2-type domain-containing protein n=1 Tax=Gossypium barbadense TaxID=3634 RepID=A0A2P5WU24_GOSBA|nr:hypothetical protein GOBAR_AA26095 [Gossypium barbadense]